MPERFQLSLNADPSYSDRNREPVSAKSTCLLINPVFVVPSTRTVSSKVSMTTDSSMAMGDSSPSRESMLDTSRTPLSMVEAPLHSGMALRREDTGRTMNSSKTTSPCLGEYDFH